MTAALDQDEFLTGISRSPFRPAWWLQGAHVQTLYPSLFRRPPQLPRVRERHTLSDGDWLYLDWHLPKAWMGSGEPLVVILHGLSGSSDSHYVLGLQAALEARGWASLAMNCRGATGEANSTPRAYHAGAHDDVAEIIEVVRERYPEVPLALVGYSLGGAITLNYLALEQVPAMLFAGVGVSVPLRLDACADRLDQGFSRVYRKHLLGELIRSWRRKARKLAELGNEEVAVHIDDVLDTVPIHNFRTLDDALFAGIHGFKDGADYYARCSPRQHLARIHVPTLLLQSSDDPFLTPECIPQRRELASAIHLEMSPRGGHVGFIEAGADWRQPLYYLERRIPDFLAVMLAEFRAGQSSSSMRKARP